MVQLESQDHEREESESRPLLQDHDGDEIDTVSTPATPDHAKLDSVVVESGSKSDNAPPLSLHADLQVAVRRGRASDVDRLLAKGAQVDYLDRHGDTTLHVCIKTTIKSEDIFMKLLTHGVKNKEEQCARANLVNRRGETPLQTAVDAGWEYGARALLRAGADATKPSPNPECTSRLDDDVGEPLFHQLVRRDDPNMLKIVLEDLEQRKLIDCRNSRGQTPLYVAIKERNIKMYKILRRHGASLKNLCDRMNALHVVIMLTRGTTFLEHMLDFKDVANIINDPNGLGYGAIHMIAAMNKAKLAEEVLNRFPKLVNVLDALGRSPLQVAVINRNRDMALLLLDRGALPTPGIIEEITKRIPNPLELLEKVLNNCITKHTDANNETTITVDFRWMAGRNGVNQLKIIEDLVRCGASKLLMHPAIALLLHTKWKRLLPIFSIILAMYVVFAVIIFSCVETISYYKDSPRNGTSEVVPQSPNEIVGSWPFIVIIDLFIAFLLFVEYLYMTVRGWAYIWQWESWTKLATLAFAAAMTGMLALADLEDPTSDDWLRNLASLAVLFAGLTVMLLCSRFPWGYNILIIGKVAANMSKILLPCVIPIIAVFALIFRILFRRTTPFNTWISGFASMWTRMLGEFNYETLFKKVEDFPLYLWFILFVIFAAIVLPNYLVGMAINDINKLTLTGNISRLRMQAELLMTLDDLVYNGIFNKILRKDAEDINKKRFVYSLTNSPDRENTWTVRYGPHYSDTYQLELPTDLHNELIARAKTGINVNHFNANEGHIRTTGSTPRTDTSVKADSVKEVHITMPEV